MAWQTSLFMPNKSEFIKKALAIRPIESAGLNLQLDSYLVF